jgi:collagenase-like PrtC family protease
MEIIVNENCAFNCENRPEDYVLMSRHHRNQSVSKEVLSQREKTKCQRPLRRFLPDRRSCNLTSEEMKRVYDMGFRRFKLQGRTDSAEAFLFDLFRYTVEPELLGQVVFKSLLSGWGSKVAGRPVGKGAG